MLDPNRPSGVFALPPGVDFPRTFIDGLLARADPDAPEALARTTIYVNTRRMQRRMQDCLIQGPARLLPKIQVIDDIGDQLAEQTGMAPSPGSLSQKLRLWRLVRALIQTNPTIAPASSAFGLAEALGKLFDECLGEGVDISALEAVDLADHAEHWQTNLQFLTLIRPYLDEEQGLVKANRLPWAISELSDRWASQPPQDPILVAGSTGSRGATRRLMQAVASLPQGAIVLPGFDFDLPGAVWAGEGAGALSEDHPQYRFQGLLASLGQNPTMLEPWHEGAAPKARNRVVSLALRPASVTSQWRREGPKLGDLRQATSGVALIEAETPRQEAEAIALRLRQAVEDGVKAAVITPDRALGRRIAAALDRWDITPDDSAGRPFALSPPARLFLHTLDLMLNGPTLETVFPLWKHPLVHADQDRNTHLLRVRECEVWLRRKRVVTVTEASVKEWAAERAVNDEAWIDWLANALGASRPTGPLPLREILDHHVALTTRLSAGPGDAEPLALWEENAGEVALRLISDLATAGDAAGPISLDDYANILRGAFASETVRDTFAPNPDVAIWGTLEARAGSAHLVILAGLNEGIWPDQSEADPWLNRTIRQNVGLLSPERRIGLQAHDFQQAVASREVVITRSLRSSEAETVPSRWLNRLTNLLGGLPEQQGPDALASMRDRGKVWTDMTAQLGSEFDPIPAEKRPAPRPPVAARPSQLSITRIQTLVRDPYAVYAASVLGLRPLDPVRPAPDAALRGTLLHEALEDFAKQAVGTAPSEFPSVMQACVDQALAKHVPWPAIRAVWRAEFSPKIPELTGYEAQRQQDGALMTTECKGCLAFPEIGFSLIGKADRVDRLADGRLEIFDYKTKAPTKKQIEHFDRQLLLEALMAEAGVFEDVPAGAVERVTYLGLGSSLKPVSISVNFLDNPAFALAEVRRDLLALIRSYQTQTQGYASRRAVAELSFSYGYDHLARYGEWDDADPPHGVDVG